MTLSSPLFHLRMGQDYPFTRYFSNQEGIFYKVIQTTPQGPNKFKQYQFIILKLYYKSIYCGIYSKTNSAVFHLAFDTQTPQAQNLCLLRKVRKSLKCKFRESPPNFFTVCDPLSPKHTTKSLFITPPLIPVGKFLIRQHPFISKNLKRFSIS